MMNKLKTVVVPKPTQDEGLATIQTDNMEETLVLLTAPPMTDVNTNR
jgi:hypothetical protein